MEPFKNKFNKQLVKHLSEQIKLEYSSFEQQLFEETISKQLEALEMKERVRLISQSLFKHLPNNFKQSSQILINILKSEKKPLGIDGFATWPLLQFIEDYGLDDYPHSFKAMYEMTQRFSAEFAIRPFIQNDPEKSFQYIDKWVSDKNEHIRRLCSEGIRPNLPWGIKVENINQNLLRGINILESLKDDPSLYVRKSVANHLNDISHLDQKLMLKTLKAWSKGNIPKERQWIIRHASRTLLKKGNPDILKLHGYNPRIKFQIKNFKLNKKNIKEGDKFTFSFSFYHQSKKSEKVIMDYIIHYLKKDGSYSKKMFRFKDTDLIKNEEYKIEKEIHFKKVTTRVHYKGIHYISLLINGKETEKISFKLK